MSNLCMDVMRYEILPKRRRMMINDYIEKKHDDFINIHMSCYGRSNNIPCTDKNDLYKLSIVFNALFIYGNDYSDFNKPKFNLLLSSKINEKYDISDFVEVMDENLKINTQRIYMIGDYIFYEALYLLYDIFDNMYDYNRDDDSEALDDFIKGELKEILNKWTATIKKLK